jgi:hypothetical protein
MSEEDIDEAVVVPRMYAELLLDERVVVGQREDHAGGGVPDVQADALAVEGLHDRAELVEDLRVELDHRAGHVEAQDDVPVRELLVHDVPVDRPGGERASGDRRQAEERGGPGEQEPHEPHAAAVARQRPDELGVRDPRDVGRPPAGPREEPPRDAARDHHERDEDPYPGSHQVVITSTALSRAATACASDR